MIFIVCSQTTFASIWLVISVPMYITEICPPCFSICCPFTWFIRVMPALQNKSVLLLSFMLSGSVWEALIGGSWPLKIHLDSRRFHPSICGRSFTYCSNLAACCGSLQLPLGLGSVHPFCLGIYPIFGLYRFGEVWNSFPDERLDFAGSVF